MSELEFDEVPEIMDDDELPLKELESFQRAFKECDENVPEETKKKFRQLLEHACSIIYNGKGESTVFVCIPWKNGQVFPGIAFIRNCHGSGTDTAIDLLKCDTLQDALNLLKWILITSISEKHHWKQAQEYWDTSLDLYLKYANSAKTFAGKLAIYLKTELGKEGTSKLHSFLIH